MNSPRLAQASLFKLESSFVPAIRDARSTIDTKEVLILRVEDLDGAVGWGEIAVFGAVADIAIAVFEQKIWPLLQTLDPAPISVMRFLDHSCFHFGQGGLVLSILSGVELALWDLLGARASLPVTALLGHCSAEVPVYASTGYYTDTDDEAGALEAQLERLNIDDFSGIKIKVGSGRDDIARVRLCRDFIGPDRFLIVDANNCFTLESGVRFARAVEDYEILFIEEPVDGADPAATRAFAESCPIAVGGYELAQRVDGFEKYLTSGSVRFLQPDTTWSGGLEICMNIAERAAVHGTHLVPHNMGTSLAAAANATLVACSRTGFALEYDCTGFEFTGLPGCESFRPKDGVLRLTDAPGWGIEPAVAEVARLASTTWSSHAD